MFPLSGLVSFWTLGPDLPALLLCMSSCFLAAPLSLSLAVGWFLCVVWFQTINLSTAPCLPSQSSHKFRLLDSAPNPELTWRGRILFSSPKPHQSFEHKWPFRPECNFRTPLPNLSVPSPALTPQPFHFPAPRPCLNVSRGLFADCWLILTSSERSCWELLLSSALSCLPLVDGPWALLLLWTRPCQL